MPAIDVLFSIGKVRKAIWKWWYPFITRRLNGEPVLFLNYAYEESPQMGIPLSEEDDANRVCLQLYHHVAAQTDLREKDVLEVGCGHGGGASYVARAFRTRRYTGLDLNPAGIRFCREKHKVSGLDFREGDAEALPFSEETFDAVINVESSHCYPDFPRFLSEVRRVLKPGGFFLYADFRFKDYVHNWENSLSGCGLRPVFEKDITPEVLRGLETNSNRSLSLVKKLLPRFLENLGRDFAGVKGSRIYNALLTGNVVYRSFLLQK